MSDCCGDGCAAAATAATAAELKARLNEACPLACGGIEPPQARILRVPLHELTIESDAPVTIRSATRTSGRSGVAPPGPDEGQPTCRRSTSCRASPAASRCGTTAPPSAPPSPSCSSATRLRCLVVLVDAFTSVGGSQYVDSPGAGRYQHVHLCDETSRSSTSASRRTILVASQASRAAATGRRARDVAARSLPRLRQPRGGGLFEVTIRPFFRVAVRALRDRYGGSVERFPRRCANLNALADPDDRHILLQWGFAAAYSADADGMIRLLYDIANAEVIPAAAVARGLPDARAAPRHVARPPRDLLRLRRATSGTST